MFGSLSMVGCEEVQDVLFDLSSFIGWGGQAYRFGVDPWIYEMDSVATPGEFILYCQK